MRSAGRISQTGLHTKAASIEPMVLSEHDITLAGTWCYPVTDWPRIIGLIAQRPAPGREGRDARRSRMDDIVEAGFETLLSPTGDQVKVLVERPRRSRRMKALQYPEQGVADVAELPSRRSPPTRCWSQPDRSGSATPTSTCSRGATSSRSRIR